MQVVRLRITIRSGYEEIEEYYFSNMQEAKKALDRWMEQGGYFVSGEDFERWDYPDCIIANNDPICLNNNLIAFNACAEWVHVNNKFDSEFEWEEESQILFERYEAIEEQKHEAYVVTENGKYVGTFHEWEAALLRAQMRMKQLRKECELRPGISVITEGHWEIDKENGSAIGTISYGMVIPSYTYRIEVKKVRIE